eukprot:gene14723-19789_t
MSVALKLKIGLTFVFMHYLASFSSRCSTVKWMKYLRRNAHLESYDIFKGGVSFESIGVCDELVQALTVIGMVNATAIQQKSFQFLSGPLHYKDVVLSSETGSGKTLAYVLPILQKYIIARELSATNKSRYPETLIVVPNKDLCKQVTAMTCAITSSLPSLNSVKTESIIESTNYWPFNIENAPNIVVSTPTLITNILRISPITTAELLTSLKEVVLDEADMLLEGSYLPHIDKILDLIKLNRRRLINEGVLLPHEKRTRFILSAATIPTHGKKSVEQRINERFPIVTNIANDDFHKLHPYIKQEYIESGTVISDDFSISDRIDVVIEAINKHKTLCPAGYATMIFTNTAERASILTEDLHNKGIDCTEFHSRLDAPTKERNLQSFRNGEKLVMVCTDSACRGLDLPNVRHVIQAEYALNIIQSVHRVGRSSRGGRKGWATNIFDKSNQELIESFRSSLDGTLEKSFSRRRSFRKGIKRALTNENDQMLE